MTIEELKALLLTPQAVTSENGTVQYRSIKDIKEALRLLEELEAKESGKSPLNYFKKFKVDNQ